MGAQLVPDGPTLRRIALLVIRAGDDDEALRRPMTEIGTVIDQLKTDIALGHPPRHDEVARLGSLIDKATRKRSKGPIHRAILAELRDLGHTLGRHVAD